MLHCWIGIRDHGLEGHLLVMVKAVYGTKSAGRAWNERFADVLRDMGFQRTKADSEVWMRRTNDLYEYLGAWVDDLAIVSKDPEAITKTLMETND